MTRGPHPRLTAPALEAIYAHARSEYPRECCGIVSGAKETDVADTVTACANIQDALHAEDPERHPRDASTAYALGPKDLFAVGRSLRSPRPVKIIYHSHIEAGAYFSDTDQAAAQLDGEPTYPMEYLVVEARRDGTHGAVQFAWDDELRRYVEVAKYDRG